jgi:hypothetical protein
MKKFAILSNHRSGASVLANTLHQHRHVLCHAEIFHPKAQIKHRLDLGITEEDVAKRQYDPLAYLGTIYSKKGSAHAVGFKMWRSQCPAACDHLLDSAEVAKIVLERENALARYSSHLLAHRNNQWGKRRGTDAEVNRAPLENFDAARFKKFVIEQRKMFSFYRARAVGRVMFLRYTDLSEDRISEVLEFIGVSPRAIGLVMEKLHSADILSRFAERLHSTITRTLEEVSHPEWVAE